LQSCLGLIWSFLTRINSLPTLSRYKFQILIQHLRFANT
jgi:hypothetical protein